MASEFRSPENRSRLPRRGLGTMGPSYHENQHQPIHPQYEHPNNITHPIGRDGVRAPWRSFLPAKPVISDQ